MKEGSRRPLCVGGGEPATLPRWWEHAKATLEQTLVGEPGGEGKYIFIPRQTYQPSPISRNPPTPGSICQLA